jgi:hypothetical protein
MNTSSALLKYEDFKHLSTKEDERTKNMVMRFGSDLNDPQPFVLTIEPSYVAYQTGKAVPLRSIEVQDYCKNILEHLRKLAFRVKQSGKTSEVLQ